MADLIKDRGDAIIAAIQAAKAFERRVAYAIYTPDGWEIAENSPDFRFGPVFEVDDCGRHVNVGRSGLGTCY